MLRSTARRVVVTTRRCRRLSTTIHAPPVLLLGDERLRRPSADCVFGESSLLAAESELHAALARFRSDNGYGRAMSAPQINRHVRMIACDLGEDAVHRPGEQPFTLCNPSVIDSSDGSFSLWDDCMSFPHLMVRLRRAESISLRYYDVHGVEHEWPSLRRQEAELLQHELDHLDGVLAVDRAEAPDTDIVPRDEYLANRAHYDRQVDYVIVPTV